MIDLAIVGAGVAGTWLAARMAEARPDWSITLLERTNRIGGRLRSLRVAGLGHLIELGGMRYLTGHTLVQEVVTQEGIPTRPFDSPGGTDRTLLRGRFADGPSDPAAAAGYDLADDERGRSPVDLLVDAFERIVPGATALSLDEWRDRRASATFNGRPLLAWSMSEAGRVVRSAEGWAAAAEAFGYDSGINLNNAGNAIPYLLGTGNPGGEARVPLDGMSRIPGALADRFEAAGGTVRRSTEVVRLDLDDEGARLALGSGGHLIARRVVLAVPIAALALLAASSPALDTAAHRRIRAAVAGYPAMKLYAWFDRPWWRGPDGPRWKHAVTDLPIRKVFYLDEGPDRPAAVLAMFTDARHTTPWVGLGGGASNGEPAPTAMLAEVMLQLRELHPEASIPEPEGSALMHWGADPAEVGWHFWREGANSDEIMELAAQPVPDLPIHLCGEIFSQDQAWAEGALSSAAKVRDRLLAGSGSPP